MVLPVKLVTSGVRLSFVSPQAACMVFSKNAGGGLAVNCAEGNNAPASTEHFFCGHGRMTAPTGPDLREFRVFWLTDSWSRFLQMSQEGSRSF